MASGDTLDIEANRNHSGKYWCSAENGLNSIVNASATLDVQCKLVKVEFCKNSPLSMQRCLTSSSLWLHLFISLILF